MPDIVHCSSPSTFVPRGSADPDATLHSLSLSPVAYAAQPPLPPAACPAWPPPPPTARPDASPPPLPLAPLGRPAARAHNGSVENERDTIQKESCLTKT
ncbi:hypothetical protein PR202_gb02378 [Eleusine coracana subsp. coracana]|uniref:Uncharacterized protein n=1 Tax=Eleusine coracana subsp. coracana TaxID=191504 RepID=A0AAV5DZZ2_ELECO|nr:hypothetical protein PR202_gb02378 [Eleusine coracana subsp. coracana]